MQPATARYGSTITICMDVRYSHRHEHWPAVALRRAQERGSSFTAEAGGSVHFNSVFPTLESAGYGLDVVCYAKSEAGTVLRRSPLFHGRSDLADVAPRSRRAAYVSAIRGDWSRRNPSTFASQTHCNGLHRIIRGALGIVSKPGAGTLIDSFGSATPIIMLEPFGPHEERNAQVWLACRFGVPYHVWADAGYPASMLEELHLNLIARRHEVKDYAQDYAETVLRDQLR